MPQLYMCLHMPRHGVWFAARALAWGMLTMVDSPQESQWCISNASILVLTITPWAQDSVWLKVLSFPTTAAYRPIVRGSSSSGSQAV